MEKLREGSLTALVTDLVDPAMLRAAEHLPHGVAVHLVQGPGLDDGGPEPGGEQQHHAVQDRHGGEESHRQEPEPEEHVDLLVDDVEGEHAQAVVAGDGAARSVLVERALGHLGLKSVNPLLYTDRVATTGHLGEHDVHGVCPVLGVLGGDGQHVPAVGGELVAQETGEGRLL